MTEPSKPSCLWALLLLLHGLPGSALNGTGHAGPEAHPAWQPWPAPHTERWLPESHLQMHTRQEGWGGTGWHAHCHARVLAHDHSAAC